MAYRNMYRIDPYANNGQGTRTNLGTINGYATGNAQLSEFGASIEGMRMEPGVLAITFAVALAAGTIAAWPL